MKSLSSKISHSIHRHLGSQPKYLSTLFSLSFLFPILPFQKVFLTLEPILPQHSESIWSKHCKANAHQTAGPRTCSAELSAVMLHVHEHQHDASRGLCVNSTQFQPSAPSAPFLLLGLRCRVQNCLEGCHSPPELNKPRLCPSEQTSQSAYS